MKALKVGAAIFTVALFGIAAVSFAAGPMCKGSGGWGKGSPYNRMYNPETMVTFSGTVSKVEKVGKMEGMSPGIHIMVTGDDPCSMAPIHLGPAWYIENQDAMVEVGDKVEVTGSRVETDDGLVIIARELRKGDETLVLRDAAGIPNWSGWRRR